MKSDFNNGVRDAQINPPEPVAWEWEECQDCHTRKPDVDIGKPKGTLFPVWLCDDCWTKREDAYEEVNHFKSVDSLLTHADMMQDDGCERE